MAKVIRHMIADYLQTAVSPSVVNTLMGTGFITLDENPSAQVDKTAYVSDKSASGTITGYQTVFPFDTQLIDDQVAVAFIYDIARNQKTGSDAETKYYRVDLYNDGDTPSFPARQFTVAIEVSNITGAGTEIVRVTGNLHQVGDLVDGTFNTTTKTFTATA